MKARNALVAAVGVCLVALTISPPNNGRTFTLSNPPSADLIRGMARSHISLVSDLLWIRAIGLSITLRTPAEGRALIAWCALITELDPHFFWPYVLGGLLGPMRFGDKVYNTLEGNALLQRGLANLPSEYRLAMYLSYNQLHLDHDPASAARTLLLGARAPNAPVFMGQLATRLLAQGDSFEAARSFAREMEESATDPEVRALFKRRRLEVERDEAIASLQRAVDEFKRTQGHLPRTFAELVSTGLLAELPNEPLGGAFQLSPSGEVSSTSGERLKAFFSPEDL